MPHLAIAWCLKPPGYQRSSWALPASVSWKTTCSRSTRWSNSPPEVMDKIEEIVDNKPAEPQRFGQYPPPDYPLGFARGTARGAIVCYLSGVEGI